MLNAVKLVIEIIKNNAGNYFKIKILLVLTGIKHFSL